MTLPRLIVRMLPAALFLFLGGAGAADLALPTVTISFAENNAPYAWFGEGRVQGLEYEIVNSVLTLGGYRLAAVPRPYARLPKVLADERIDGITGQHPDDLPGYFFSEPYMTYENYVIVREDSGIAWQDFDGMLSHSVVAWRGAALFLGLEQAAPQRFAAVNGKTYLEFTDQPTTFRYFWNRRAEILISDKYLYQTFLREHPEMAREAPSVIYLRELPNAVRIAFKSSQQRDAFDQALRHFKESGGYQRLLDRFHDGQAFEEMAELPRHP